MCPTDAGSPKRGPRERGTATRPLRLAWGLIGAHGACTGDR